MIRFDVYRNGEPLCKAGKEDLIVMSAILSWVSPSDNGPEELTLHVAGLRQAPEGSNIHPKWLDRTPLTENDEITIRLLRSDTADTPTSETTWDQQSTRQQEFEYHQHLKAKFETGESRL